MWGIFASVKVKQTLLAALFALALPSCTMTPKLDVPRVAGSEPITIPSDEKLATIAFEKVVSSLKRGTVVAAYPDASTLDFKTTMCNLKSQGEVVWASGGNHVLSGWDSEFGQAFYEAMSGRGYQLVGDPKTVFRTPGERESANYLIAARLLDVRAPSRRLSMNP